jgi:phytanoyl-CoA dioxygenase PhyH
LCGGWYRGQDFAATIAGSSSPRMRGGQQMTDQTLVGDDVLDRYERDGFTTFRNVLDPDLMAEAAGHVQWLQEKHPDVRPENLGHIYLRNDPFWVRLISDPRLVDIASIFIGNDVALFASHYISKPPFSGRPVLWHQDGAYWPLEPMEVVTLWLAVDPATTENGCMRVIPGSHKEGLHSLRDNHEVDNVLGSQSDVEVDESTAVDLVLEPGDVEVHHPNIMHGSNANTSPQRRCGLTIRYIPTSTRITADEQPYPSAFHLRGNPGVNTYQPVPTFVPGEHFPFRDSAKYR